MPNANKPNKSKTPACGGKKNATNKVECVCCKSNANFLWSALMQVSLFIAKSLLEHWQR